MNLLKSWFHELFSIFDKQTKAYLLKIDCLKSSVSRR